MERNKKNKLDSSEEFTIIELIILSVAVNAVYPFIRSVFTIVNPIELVRLLSAVVTAVSSFFEPFFTIDNLIDFIRILSAVVTAVLFFIKKLHSSFVQAVPT
jgi:hypothetical protein